MNTPVTIYLADDHQIIIDGLKLLIGSEDNMKVVGSANDGITAYNEIMNKRPDLALVDLRMPGMTGLDIIFKFRKTDVKTRFVILSMHDNEREIKDAMINGAAGFLLKNSGKAELMNCLFAVMSGEQFFPTLRASKKTEQKPFFTPREYEIMKLILDGHTTVNIADELCLSSRTIETHRKNICRKTKTNTPLALARFLRDNQIEL